MAAPVADAPAEATGVEHDRIRTRIRRARPEEAVALSDLALRSKGLWGYDAAFMEACRISLSIDPEAVAALPFNVLDEAGTITGFYGLSGQPHRGEIEFLFVDPEGVRRGRGRLLARHFLALARRLGFDELEVSADPFAEGFYAAMRAVSIGKVPSDAIPNRVVPRLRFSLIADRGAVPPV